MLSMSDMENGIDTRAISMLSRKYTNAPSLKSGHRVKFCDWHRGMEDALDYIAHLGLDRARGLRILDIGCGFGYFVRACSLLEHEVSGLDMADPLHGDVWKLLGVRSQIREYVVAYGKPLPDDLKDFDLITMFGFGLVRYMPKETWQHYAPTILDVLSRLRPGGRYFSLENVGREWKYSLRLWQALVGKRGAVAVRMGNWRGPTVEVKWNG